MFYLLPVYYPQVLLVFWVVYCHFEGLTVTDDMTRQVLLYLFHGKCSKRVMKKGFKEDMPIVCIRKQYVAGSYNFSKFVKYFAKLTDYVDSHEGEFMAVLTEGAKPCETILWMVENCLRTVGKLPHSPLGHACMSTASAWDSVEPYKKEWMWYYTGGWRRQCLN